MSVADPILCPNEFWDPVLKNEDENSVVIFEEKNGLRLLRSTMMQMGWSWIEVTALLQRVVESPLLQGHCILPFFSPQLTTAKTVSEHATGTTVK